MSDTRIRYFEEKDVEGEMKAVYDEWLAANPDRDHFPAILKCFGATGNADILRGAMQFCYPLQFADGRLGRKRKELIAAYVSGLNQCPY